MLSPLPLMVSSSSFSSTARAALILSLAPTPPGVGMARVASQRATALTLPVRRTKTPSSLSQVDVNPPFTLELRRQSGEQIAGDLCARATFEWMIRFLWAKEKTKLASTFIQLYGETKPKRSCMAKQTPFTAERTVHGAPGVHKISLEDRSKAVPLLFSDVYFSRQRKVGQCPRPTETILLKGPRRRRARFGVREAPQNCSKFLTFSGLTKNPLVGKKLKS